MKNTFLISEVAKMHHIPAKTLRYYHEVGLLVPAIIDEKNGYRYYTTEQFEQLSTIRYLKFLGIPLKEIKEHLEKKEVGTFIQLLQEQKEATESKIKELERVKNRFDRRIEELQHAMQIPRPHEIQIKKMPERTFFSLRERITSEPELELSLRKLVNHYELNTDLIIGKVVLTVSKDNLERQVFDEYDAINVIEEEAVHHGEPLHVLEAGLYAFSYHQGGHEESGFYYNKLLTYLHKNGYQVIGDAYERIIINEYISHNQEDFLTEIQIPIKNT